MAYNITRQLDKLPFRNNMDFKRVLVNFLDVSMLASVVLSAREFIKALFFMEEK